MFKKFKIHKYLTKKKRPRNKYNEHNESVAICQQRN